MATLEASTHRGSRRKQVPIPTPNINVYILSTLVVCSSCCDMLRYVTWCACATRATNAAICSKFVYTGRACARALTIMRALVWLAEVNAQQKTRNYPFSVRNSFFVLLALGARVYSPSNRRPHTRSHSTPQNVVHRETPLSPQRVKVSHTLHATLRTLCRCCRLCCSSARADRGPPLPHTHTER